MNAYNDACKVEAEGVEDICRFLSQQLGSGKFILISKGKLAKDIQKKHGDCMIETNSGYMQFIEFKVENKTTGNLFLEVWSNKSRRTTGWMFHLNTDYLFYYFLDSRKLYVFDFDELALWAFGSREQKANIWRYREVPQSAYSQKNDTWGRIVPIQALVDSLNVREYQLEESAFT